MWTVIYDRKNLIKGSFTSIESRTLLLKKGGEQGGKTKCKRFLLSLQWRDHMWLILNNEKWCKKCWLLLVLLTFRWNLTENKRHLLYIGPFYQLQIPAEWQRDSELLDLVTSKKVTKSGHPHVIPIYLWLTRWDIRNDDSLLNKNTEWNKLKLLNLFFYRSLAGRLTSL